MNHSIIQLLRQGESETVEFKSTFGKEVIESLCAFANNIGGVVLVGIENSGKITGVNYGSESIQDWVNQIKQGTSPSIVPDIRLLEINRKQVVEISVNEGLNEGLNEGENKLFDTIKKNPGIRIPEMAKILLSPKKTVERWISKLKKMNLIEYRGSKKTGGYFVLNRK